MPFVTVGRENSAAIRIYYEDQGPVLLSCWCTATR